MNCRLGFIVEAKSELTDHLKSLDSDLLEYFNENHILTTDELEYEEFFEGWKNRIQDSAKVEFIRTTVYGLDFSKPELENLFGNYSNEIELFNRWWSLKEANCEIIPTNWQNT